MERIAVTTVPDNVDARGDSPSDARPDARLDGAHYERTCFRPRVVALALSGVTLCAALASRIFGGPTP